MRNIFITLLTAISCLGLLAQTAPVKVRTLVVKTNDGKTTRFNLGDVAELTFEDGTNTVTRVMNLTPDFLSVSGIREGQQLTAGETYTLTLKAEQNLSEFNDYHFEHIHIHINDMVIMPVVPDGYTPVDEIEVPFTAPEGNCDIVVCYSVQQQLINTGYTMSLTDHPAVKLYGVSPTAHYKYFDAYLLADEAYVITDAEYKMGDGNWTEVNGTSGCKLVRADNGVDNLYRISIRPEYQNVTGDVTLRVTGEQHERHTITWKNGTAEYLDLEKSTLPTLAINGDMVYAELYVNNQYYLNGATASAEGTGIETMNRCYVRFTMPKEDVTVTLDFLSKVPVGYTASEHVVKAQMYDAPDTYYGIPTEIGIPGENVYLFVNVEEGYKPMIATTDDGKTFNFQYYGPNHAGLPYYCPVTISEGAASMTASVNCEKAWTISSEQVVEFSNGGVYAAGETVNFAMQVPAGKQIDTVKAVTASGTEVPVTLDLPYGTLVMPGEDVTVTVTYSDLTAGDTVTVIADYDQDQYGVNSSTNYDWDFAEGFTMDKGATFYLSVIDYYGENFYVGVKVGETVTVYPAVQDEDSGEYSFGKAIVADGNVTIKVRASESAITF